MNNSSYDKAEDELYAQIYARIEESYNDESLWFEIIDADGRCVYTGKTYNKVLKRRDKFWPDAAVVEKDDLDS